MTQEEHILQSWHTNAAAWTNAISQGAIESRRLVTNKAIVDAIVLQQPRTVLDVGCGEGWLCRALQEKGIETTGIDAIPALIASAQQAGRGSYEVCSYQDLLEGKFQPAASFDAIVFNFALFGDTLVRDVLKQLANYLSPGGKLIIQTLHPHTASVDQPYKTGWRNGSWAGFSDEFSDPAPWYFRTMESWSELFMETGYMIHQLREPLHPDTGKPASVIFICTR